MRGVFSALRANKAENVYRAVVSAGTVSWQWREMADQTEESRRQAESARKQSGTIRMDSIEDVMVLLYNLQHACATFAAR